MAREGGARRPRKTPRMSETRVFAEAAHRLFGGTAPAPESTAAVDGSDGGYPGIRRRLGLGVPVARRIATSDGERFSSGSTTVSHVGVVLPRSAGELARAIKNVAPGAVSDSVRSLQKPSGSRQKIGWISRAATQNQLKTAQMSLASAVRFCSTRSSTSSISRASDPRNGWSMPAASSSSLMGFASAQASLQASSAGATLERG